MTSAFPKFTSTTNILSQPDSNALSRNNGGVVTSNTEKMRQSRRKSSLGSTKVHSRSPVMREDEKRRTKRPKSSGGKMRNSATKEN